MNRRKFVRDVSTAAVGACLAVDSLQVADMSGVRMLEVCGMTKIDMGSDPYGYICKMWPQFIASLREEGFTEKLIKKGFLKPEPFGNGSYRFTFHPA